MLAGSLVFCQASAWALSLLRPGGPVRSQTSLATAALLSPHTSLSLSLSPPPPGLPRAWGGGWGSSYCIGLCCPLETESRELCRLTCDTCAGTGLRAARTSPWKELAEPASEAKQCLKYCNGHGAAGIHRRLESANLGGDGPGTELKSTSRIWTREGEEAAGSGVGSAHGSDISGRKS